VERLLLGASEEGADMTTNDCGSSKRDIVQVKNPCTDRYVKIDRTAGLIIAHKKSQGPYKGVPVARAKK
jgi:glutamate dehydrogenase/leucine dehydrogenase